MPPPLRPPRRLHEQLTASQQRELQLRQQLTEAQEVFQAVSPAGTARPPLQPM